MPFRLVLLGNFENFDILAEDYSENLQKSPNFGAGPKNCSNALYFWLVMSATDLPSSILCNWSKHHAKSWRASPARMSSSWSFFSSSFAILSRNSSTLRRAAKIWTNGVIIGWTELSWSWLPTEPRRWWLFVKYVGFSPLGGSVVATGADNCRL